MAQASRGAQGLVEAYAAQAKGQAKVTPVQKVIELLTGMMEKGKKEKHEEQLQYNGFKQYCDDTTVEKTRAIDEANQMIEVLKADIQKYAATAELLTKEIAEHDEDISVWNGDMKAATKVREIEKADYEETHKDYEESIDALTRAIAVLKKQAYDRPQAESFAQVKALKDLVLIPDDAKKSIDTFLAQDETLFDAPEAPGAAGYEFQSHGIIDMLEKLLSKFADELKELEKEEVASKHAYDMLIEDLTAQVDDSTARRDAKAQEKAKTLEAKAQAESDLEDTTAARDADVKFLEDLTAQCEQKASDFESRQALRQGEIEAIMKAIEILQSAAVSGNAEKHLPTFVQKKGTALSQLRSSSVSPAQQRVAEYLRERAQSISSRVLSALAERVSSDPFKKVRKMIRDLITKLQEEAAEEADHKAWCDTELAANEQTRKEKTDQVEMLHAEIDELTAEITKLAQDITDLTHAIAEIDAAVKKATALREAEKAKNTETIGDAKEAQDAVTKAMEILKDFYAKAGEATALVQAPEIFDSPYKGMQAESGGVIGMLEVILSDFERLQAETEAAEEKSQKEYDEFMADSEADKAAKTKDMEDKTVKKQDKEQALEIAKTDLAGNKEELQAALEYYDKLKPSCIEVGVSYEDRVARRKEEIESLQQALKILNGEDVAPPEE